jgi:N-acetylglucosamine kinase-like BadF-type ATPase
LKTAVILAADGGNSKTELLAATRDGEVLAYRRGPGSNSHAIGADGTAAVLQRLVGATGVEQPGEAGAVHGARRRGGHVRDRHARTLSAHRREVKPADPARPQG